MKKLTLRLIVIVLVIAALYFFFNKWQVSQKEQQNQLQLQELRGVAKLVIWEQKFTLHNTESISRKYFGMIETKESIHSAIDGKMGFHIDLADSVHTRFTRKEDTIIISAPLRNTYIELDLATLEQVKESSLDPSLEIKKEEVVKNLRQKAVEEFIPNIQNNISQKDISYQEEKLSRLTKTPVKIRITEYPEENQIHWRE